MGCLVILSLADPDPDLLARIRGGGTDTSVRPYMRREACSDGTAFENVQ